MPITYFFRSTMAYQVLSVLLSLGSLILIYKLLKGESFATGLAVLALAAFNPLMVDLSGVVLPEVPYLFFTLLVFYLWGQWDRGRKISNLVIIGILSAYCFYLRPDGAAVSVALFVSLLLGRRFRRAFIFALVVGVIVAPYFIRNYLIRGYLFWYGAAFEGAVSHNASLKNLLDSLVWQIPFYAREVFVRNLFRWPSSALEPVLSGLSMAVGVVFLGWGLLLKNPNQRPRLSINIYLFIYVAAHLFWHLQSSRYLHAILPFVYIYFFRGLEAADKRMFKKPILVGSAAILSLALLVSPVTHIVRTSLFLTTPTNTPPVNTYSWIRKSTKSHEVFAAEMDGEVYFLTGRSTYYFVKGLGEAQFRAWIQTRGIDYLLYTNTDMMLKSRDGAFNIDPLTLDYLQRQLGFQLVFQDPAEKTLIFKTHP